MTPVSREINEQLTIATPSPYLRIKLKSPANAFSRQTKTKMYKGSVRKEVNPAGSNWMQLDATEGSGLLEVTVSHCDPPRLTYNSDRSDNNLGCDRINGDNHEINFELHVA